MGDLTDFGKLLGIKEGTTESKAVEVAQGAIATISGIGTIAGAVSLFLALFGESDAVDTGVKQLAQDFQVVFAEQQAEDFVRRMREVETRINDARVQED